MNTLDPIALMEQTMQAIEDECRAEKLFLGTVNALAVVRKHLSAALSQPQAGEPVVPAFHAVAKRKLDELVADGWSVNGYAIIKDEERRGFVDFGGFVGWWLPEYYAGHTSDASPQPALAVKAGEMTYGQKLIAEAIEAHFGDQEDAEEDSDDTTHRDVWEAFDALVASPSPSGAVEALRKAIEPFAAVLDEYDPADEDDGTPGTFVAGSVTAYSLTLGDFRRARRALSTTPATAEGWRTMDSAPRDGTSILYRNQFLDIGFCHWDEGLLDDDQPCWWDNEADQEVRPAVWLPADTLPAFPAAPTATGGQG